MRGLALVLLIAGCLDPADERARRDLDEVGRAEGVHIDPGLVHTATPGEVHLRASAPVVTVTLDGPPRDVRVRVDNLPVPADFVARAPGTYVVGPPDHDVPRPVRFVWISDVHADPSVLPRLPADVDFILSGGDLVDTGASAAEWDAVMVPLPVPLYAAVGNHELNGGDGEEHHARLGRMSYAFSYHGVRFVVFDSASGTVAPRVHDLIAAARADVAVTHIPPIDPSGLRNGGFSSRLEGERVLAELGDVDLLLTGHLHGFETDGKLVVSGGGARSNQRLDGIGRHYLVVTADGTNVTVERVDLEE